MEIEFSAFIASLMANPLLVMVVILNIGVIVVNGATDAPNAIATVVSTKAMKPRIAVLMAATCNFLGLLIVTFFTSAVANTIFHMVDFGGDSHAALVALFAAMVAIIVWGVTAWYFGIPTSQSHSLIAGLTGAAIAVSGGLDGVNGAEWMKVVYGILLSTFLGFGLGWLGSKGITALFASVDRRKADKAFRRAQVGTAACSAFMHGAQDGQKFISIFILAITLAMNDAAGDASNMALPIWLMLLCALCMGVGTASGGTRIIKNVGMNMVKLDPYQGFAASCASTLCLIGATLGGLPVSTTHTNSTAIMGTGAAQRIRAVKWDIAFDMVKTWVLTFPGCGLMGFVFAEIFLAVL